jgi:pimeloyl-ACP methyl ester carboxylesterase
MRCRRFAMIVVCVLFALESVSAQRPPQPEFVQVQTDDSVSLSGAVWMPPGRPRPIAVVLTGGTGAEFYQLAHWGELFAGAGYTTVALNLRDHGASFGYEPFEKSALDLRYAIDVAVRRGATRVVLIARSYGTVTASYYLVTARDKRVGAAILLAPIADLRDGSVKILGQEAYDEAVKVARQMVAEGKGQQTYVMPSSPGRAVQPALISYEVFLNKRGPEAKTAPAELLRTADVPILAVRDPADPLPGTVPPAQQQLEAATRRLEYILLPDTRAGRSDPRAHAFVGRESEVFKLMLDWMAKHGQ